MYVIDGRRLRRHLCMETNVFSNIQVEVVHLARLGIEWDRIHIAASTTKSACGRESWRLSSLRGWLRPHRRRVSEVAIIYQQKTVAVLHVAADGATAEACLRHDGSEILPEAFRARSSSVAHVRCSIVVESRAEGESDQSLSDQIPTGASVLEPCPGWREIASLRAALCRAY